MQTAKWIDLPLYEGFYKINEAGQIKSIGKRNFNKILTQRIGRGGYYAVRLTKSGKTTTHFVHRLLATTYIPNPLNKPEVNHKDVNKLNNTLDNLEWVTHSENIKHAYKNKAIIKENQFKAKKVIDTCANIIYPSIAAAQKLTRYSYSHFKRLLHGFIPNDTCFKLVG